MRWICDGEKAASADNWQQNHQVAAIFREAVFLSSCSDFFFLQSDSRPFAALLPCCRTVQRCALQFLAKAARQMRDIVDGRIDNEYVVISCFGHVGECH